MWRIRYTDLLTCKIHKALTLICFTIDSFLSYRKEDTPYMQSFILSKGLPLQLFPNSVVSKGELECCDCDGSRKLTLVDAKAIWDVAFGFPKLADMLRTNFFLSSKKYERIANIRVITTLQVLSVDHLADPPIL